MRRLAWVLLLFASCATPGDADLRLVAGRTRVIVHRGSTGPDGTVAGCRKSLAAGISFLELDVRLTKDGHAVILHDPTVDRTTDGKGAVAGMTLEELKRLDAGAKYDPRYAGERVPTVAELLRAVAGRGVVLLELKVPAAARPVFDAIRQEKAFDWAVVRSEKTDLLMELRAWEPRVLTGTMGPMPDDAAPLLALGVRAFTPKDNATLTQVAVRKLQAAGIAVWGTNTNDEAVMRRLIETGVDGIITDRPELLQSLLGN